MAYCETCHRGFIHQAALSQHYKNSSRHEYCFRCDYEFPSGHALKQHEAVSARHNICAGCQDDFSDAEDLEDHIEQCHWHCGTCGVFVDSEADLVVHYLRSSSHLDCGLCDRYFSNRSNFKAHLRSSTHANLSVKCPGCSRMFITISGMIIHLESGTCQSGIDRQKLNQFVRSRDPTHIITKPLLTNGDPIHNNTTQTYATGASWNGSSYVCYFCHRGYGSLRALNQHLSSPAHEQALYHCPKCRGQFKLLSGIVQHVESESCGIARFDQVQGTFDKFTSGLRLIAQ